jgi:hypothetical protein
VINFRYHLVSLVAVFLALGIGVIMGTAVIDSAVVDRLEAQQQGLEAQISDVRTENDELRTQLRDLREASEQLAAEGSERLLDGALRGQPVLVVGVRGVEAEGLRDLESIIQTADAQYQGTIWLTDRFALDDDDERRDLAGVLGFTSDTGAASLRSAAISRLSLLLRRQAPVEEDPDPSEGAEEAEEGVQEQADLVVALREAGFVDVEGLDTGSSPQLRPGTRVVVLSGSGAAVDDRDLALPLIRSLVREIAGLPPAGVLAVEATPAAGEDEGEAASWLSAIRADDQLATRVSTVDNIEEFAGRLAAVLAVQELGVPRYGHYGRGEGAQRLLPAPVE